MICLSRRGKLPPFPNLQSGRAAACHAAWVVAAAKQGEVQGGRGRREPQLGCQIRGGGPECACLGEHGAIPAGGAELPVYSEHSRRATAISRCGRGARVPLASNYAFVLAIIR